MSAQPALALVNQRVIAPTLFRPGADPETFLSLAEAFARIHALADGRELTFRMGRAAYPDFEDFPSITARADGEHLATLGGPWPSERHQTAARDELRRLAA